MQLVQVLLISIKLTRSCIFLLFTDCRVCEAKSEGLVHYPTTLAPVSGSVTVTAHCADNAHTTNFTSLNITCNSDGSWSVQISQCVCDEGYHETTPNGTHICKGEENLHLRFILFIHFVHTLIQLTRKWYSKGKQIYHLYFLS